MSKPSCACGTPIDKLSWPPADIDDPLMGVRTATGIADLAEHFDDYRLGRR